MQHVFKIQDVIEALSGVEDGDTSDLGTAWANHRAEVRASVDNLVTGLFGWIGTGFSNDDQAQAIQDVAATIAGLSASVTALQNSRNNQSVGGTGAVVDFTSMPTGALPATFDLFYSGAAGSLQIQNGAGAYWSESGNGDRTCNFVFNDLETATDYQKIWLAFGSSPEWRNSSTAAVNEIHGRKNASGDTYVFASMTKYTAQIGCCVGGFRTVFQTKSTGFSFKAGGLYALECGTTGGLRTYRLLEGSTVIMAHTEVGTTSQLGSGFKRSGGSVTAKGITLGQLSPGVLAAFALSDNQATTLVGSFAKMYRASTSAVGISNGYNELPSSFFDNLAGITEDYSYSFTDGSWTVANDGNYWISVQSRTTGVTAPDQIVWVAYVNGEEVARVGNSFQRGNSEVGGVRIPTATGASTVVSLQAGDTVSWGYWSSDPLVSFLLGEASGKETYFSIALINRSLA